MEVDVEAAVVADGDRMDDDVEAAVGADEDDDDPLPQVVVVGVVNEGEGGEEAAGHGLASGRNNTKCLGAV